MPRPPSTPKSAPIAYTDPPATESGSKATDFDHIVELERALSRISHLLTRARRHDRTATEAGVDVDRASVPVLRILAEADQPIRLGELAALLDVEPPHVTRQIQRLERSGFVSRIPDPADRRAQQVRLTSAGRDAVDALRAISRRNIREGLTQWSSADLRLLATLNHRMVDDFLANAERTKAFDDM